MKLICYIFTNKKFKTFQYFAANSISIRGVMIATEVAIMRDYAKCKHFLSKKCLFSLFSVLSVTDWKRQMTVPCRSTTSLGLVYIQAVVQGAAILHNNNVGQHNLQKKSVHVCIPYQTKIDLIPTFYDEIKFVITFYGYQ